MSNNAYIVEEYIIIIISKNECHSNVIVDRLQGCSHSKKLRESESESRSSKYVAVVLVVGLHSCDFSVIVALDTFDSTY